MLSSVQPRDTEHTGHGQTDTHTHTHCHPQAAAPQATQVPGHTGREQPATHGLLQNTPHAKRQKHRRPSRPCPAARVAHISLILSPKADLATSVLAHTEATSSSEAAALPPLEQWTGAPGMKTRMPAPSPAPL